MGLANLKKLEKQGVVAPANPGEETLKPTASDLDMHDFCNCVMAGNVVCPGAICLHVDAATATLDCGHWKKRMSTNLARRCRETKPA